MPDLKVAAIIKWQHALLHDAVNLVGPNKTDPIVAQPRLTTPLHPVYYGGNTQGAVAASIL